MYFLRLSCMNKLTELGAISTSFVINREHLTTYVDNIFKNYRLVFSYFLYQTLRTRTKYSKELSYNTGYLKVQHSQLTGDDSVYKCKMSATNR